jgi:uncharacterized protein YbjT (DUF2867 family)
VHRTKALAEQAVAESALRTSILRCSLIYAPGDTKLALLEALALLPVVPVTATMGRARVQPVWADDVAACVAAVLDADEPPAELEIAGPETLTFRQAVERALAAGGRRRRLVTVPTNLLLRTLHAYEAVTGPVALATRDEADALGATMLSARGVADAQSLGVDPLPIASVLAA